MRRAIVGLAVLGFALSFACTSDSPVTPTTQPFTTAVSPPPPAPAGDTSPTAPTPPADRWAKDSFEMKVLQNDGDAFRVQATNITEENIGLRLSCYEGPPNDPPSQKFFSSGGSHSMGAGSTATFECLPACGAGQGDLHEGPALDPPVGWGRALALGRPTRGSGERCEPPPPPPPSCNVSKLRLDAAQECGELDFTIDTNACTFECEEPKCELTKESCESPFVFNEEACACECDATALRELAGQRCEYGIESLNTSACTYECKPPPPTCEELNPPSHSNFARNVSSTHITASYTAHNEGSWSLTLYAGSPNNPKRYRKAHDTARLKCDEDERLSISYRHRGHNSCLWTLVASGPTIDFNQVVLNRCGED